ncbi:MAG: glycosylasparaginase [Bacteroides sp. SM23_62_1]|nr:MAG: glycosylasparaginase [Bacteroides sp. SM23_62_1]
MYTRRTFLQTSIAASLGVAVSEKVLAYPAPLKQPKYPVVVSTWSHGLKANKAAWEILGSSGYALDAVESGVRITEADPAINSVGYGGLPDGSGEVTLDACIMDEKGNAGSVVCLRYIMHPVSVARKIMEKTPHVILADRGALQFAISQGFKEEDLLTPESRKAYETWKISGGNSPADRLNHDTIGMLAMDTAGNLAGACTTSGLAFKLPGRVGDSPIIGAGLYVDNEVGAATATGLGELILKISGSFLIVELMRNGWSPGNACREAVLRINKKFPFEKSAQVGFIAVTRNGETGGYSLKKGFDYAVCRDGINELVNADYLI